MAAPPTPEPGPAARSSRDGAAQTLRRTGRVTVKFLVDQHDRRARLNHPQVMFAPTAGGETGMRHKVDLRLD